MHAAVNRQDLGSRLRPLQPIYCVDSVDWESLYCCWCQPSDRIRRHNAFEDYVLNELMPLMATKNPHPYTIAHGCSLGAFHAVNIAFRHPHLFRSAPRVIAAVPVWLEPGRRACRCVAPRSHAECCYRSSDYKMVTIPQQSGYSALLLALGAITRPRH